MFVTHPSDGQNSALSSGDVGTVEVAVGERHACYNYLTASFVVSRD